jgi:heme oxygenase
MSIDLDLATAREPMRLAHPKPTAAKSQRPSLRFRLRDATAKDHGRLDAVFAPFDLRKPEDYRRFLEINAAALVPLEKALAASGVSQVIPDWPQRSRVEALQSDVARLGGAIEPSPAIATLDRDEIFGALYVLEGSRLGARVLLPIVLGSDDLRVATTNAYLSHGLDRPLWQSFVAMLERHGETIEDDSGVIGGASLAFDIFARAARA